MYIVLNTTYGISNGAVDLPIHRSSIVPQCFNLFYSSFQLITLLTVIINAINSIFNFSFVYFKFFSLFFSFASFFFTPPPPPPFPGAVGAVSPHRPNARFLCLIFVYFIFNQHPSMGVLKFLMMKRTNK